MQKSVPLHPKIIIEITIYSNYLSKRKNEKDDDDRRYDGGNNEC